MKKPLIILLISVLFLFFIFVLFLSVKKVVPVDLQTNTTTVASTEAPDTIPTVTDCPDTTGQIQTDTNFTPPATTQKIALNPISQYPELPTGCEITSLTMALKFHGLNVDKCDLSDNYLKKGAVGTVDFREAFEGDPRDPNSYGCYAPVIVDCANSYLTAHASPLRAKDISGTALNDLFSYIDNGTPVIIWGTRNCEQGHYSTTWYVNGKELQWFTPEHCMVLVGYSDSNIYVADPLYGDVRAYDKNIFSLSYTSLYKQAVVIE